MAKKYKAEHIWQLLHICSWKNNNELSFSQFSSLADSINQHVANNDLLADPPIIHQDYLGTLLRDVNDQLKKGESISRQSSYINTILKYINFSGWDAFEKALTRVVGTLDIEKWIATDYSELKTAIYAPETLKDQLYVLLDYPKKVVESSISMKFTRTSKNTAVNDLEELKQEFPFIIWIIDEEMDTTQFDKSELEKINQLIQNKNIIPLKFNDRIEGNEATSQLLNKSKVLIGHIGLLLILSSLEITQKMMGEFNTPPKNLFGGKMIIENINNSGTINTGDVKQENHGGNNAGGNIIQNYYTKGDQ